MVKVNLLYNIVKIFTRQFIVIIDVIKLIGKMYLYIIIKEYSNYNFKYRRAI